MLDIIITAVLRAAEYWPLLLLVVLAQFLHELTHFVVAWALGTEAIIQIRLTRPMRVLYDDESVTLRGEAAIGLAPTVAGLAALWAWVWAVGWPNVTPVTVGLAVAWLLYTVPSSEDTSALGPMLDPEGQVDEPLRSVLIGMGAMAMGALAPALPYPQHYLIAITNAIAVGALAYILVAFYEYGVPEEWVESSVD